MTLSLRGIRLRLHPALLIMPLLAAHFGLGRQAAAVAVCLCLHECGHLIAARWLGMSIRSLELTPFGGAIYAGNPYVQGSGRLLAVSLAGPAANLLCAVLCAAMAQWGLLTPGQAALPVRVNAALAGFNLLPALPLDGGRALYALARPRLGPRRAAAMGLWAGRVLALLIAAHAVADLLMGRPFNLTLWLAALFLARSASREREALAQAAASKLLDALKPLPGPTPVQLYAIEGGCPAREALRCARSDRVTLYAVYENGRLTHLRDERSLLEQLLPARKRFSASPRV